MRKKRLKRMKTERMKRLSRKRMRRKRLRRKKMRKMRRRARSPHTPGLEATPLPAHGGSCPHRIVETGQSQHAGDDRHTTTFI